MHAEWLGCSTDCRRYLQELRRLAGFHVEHVRAPKENPGARPHRVTSRAICSRTRRSIPILPECADSSQHYLAALRQEVAFHGELPQSPYLFKRDEWLQLLSKLASPLR